MMRRLLLAALFALPLAATSVGCCVDSYGMRRGALGQRFEGDDCGSGGCGRRGPLGLAGRRATCGAGCGELYIDEWLSDPPDCCDPCDGFGGFTGRGGCGGCGDGGCGDCGDSGCGGSCGGNGPGRNWTRRFPGGIGSIWGHRYRPGMSYGGFGDEYYEGEEVYSGDMHEGYSEPLPPASHSPTPAARQTPSAIKKSAGRQPYYEQESERPAMSRVVSPRSSGGSRSASNWQPKGSSSRTMR